MEDNRKIQIRENKYSAPLMVEYRIDPSEVCLLKKLFNRWKKVKLFCIFKYKDKTECSYQPLIFMDKEKYNAFIAGIKTMNDINKYERAQKKKVEDFIKTIKENSKSEG